jgi:hypothetical protein
VPTFRRNLVSTFMVEEDWKFEAAGFSEVCGFTSQKTTIIIVTAART